MSVSRVTHPLLESKVCHQLSWSLVSSMLPASLINEVLTDCQAWEQREKKINMQALVYFILGLSLFADRGMPEVWRELIEGQQAVGIHLESQVPSASALSQRRTQLGVAPMRELFARAVHPLATAATRGAFAFNLRLVAVDGTVDELPDTLANRTAFPPDGGTTGSRVPQLRCTLLMECGTHAIFDVQITSIHQGEQQEAMILLERSLQAHMLLLWDSGFRDFDLLTLARRKGAHVLGRLPKKQLHHCWARLSDGTYLAKVAVNPKSGRGHRMTVRVIEYTLTQPSLAQASQVYRLVTTLLDPEQYPAWRLIQLYHERWEIESSIDEYKTHLRLASHPLRSHTPQGVEQAVYGLLLVHFLVRALIHLSALQADVDPDRLSFTHTVGVLRRSLSRFAHTPWQKYPALRQQILEQIRAVRVPVRRLRFQPRVLKRARPKFPPKPLGFRPTRCFSPPFLDGVRLI